MSEWPEVLLEDHVDLITGYPFQSKYYTQQSQDVPLLSGYNIVQGEIRWDRFNRWPSGITSGLDKYLLDVDDVVLAMDRPWIDAGLKYAWIRENDLPVLLVQRTARLRGTASLDTTFLRYLIGSRDFEEHIKSVTTGTAVPHISPTGIGQFRFTLPPLPIQRRIAAILGRLDDKIEVNRRINHTLEAMAQALYRHWFVDFGPFQAGAFVESALGLIPVGWTTTTLKEITTKIGSGATPRGGSSVYIDEGINLIRSQNVYDSAFSWDGLAHITDDAAEKLRTVTVEAGDVLINITGDSILRTCVADEAVLPARVNQHVAIIRPIAEVPPHFVHQHLLRSETKEMLFNMSAGATRKAITKGNLEDTPILLPPTRVLDKFRCKTDPFFAQIAVNNRESHKLAEIRDYLLPKLLSGEVGVAAEDS